MAGLLSELSVTQVAEFVKRLGCASLDIDDFRALLRDNGLVRHAVGEIKGYRREASYSAPPAVREVFRARCAERGIDSLDFELVGPQHGASGRPGSVWVLMAHLDTPEATLRFVYDWMHETHPVLKRTSGLPFPPRMADDTATFFAEHGFRPMTLRWVEVGIDVPYRTSAAASGCALMYLCAQQPEAFAALSRGGVSNFVISGVLADGYWGSDTCGGALAICVGPDRQPSLDSTGSERVHGSPPPRLFPVFVR